MVIRKGERRNLYLNRVAQSACTQSFGYLGDVNTGPTLRSARAKTGFRLSRMGMSIWERGRVSVDGGWATAAAVTNKNRKVMAAFKQQDCAPKIGKWIWDEFAGRED